MNEMKKHIVCFGDSNTHGYCADPRDCADGGDRFNENERWTCLLQKALGEEYPELPLRLALPDETFRRVGQSAVAASLPEIKR